MPSSSVPPAYPSEWESDVVLADGDIVHVRPIRPDDEPEMRTFFARLSPETIYLRFHARRRFLSDAEWEHFTRVDYADRMALVAEARDGDIVAVAGYDRLPDDPDLAEVAFTVEDAHQGRGIATLLFEHLVAVAREQGIERFLAYVLPDNHAMTQVFQTAGFPLQQHTEPDLIEVTIPLELTDQALTAIEDREFRAGARSVARLLGPTSIAVVGAGRERGNIGHEVFRNLLAGDFNGPVVPIHPSADAIASVTAYHRLPDVPHEVDLAVLAVAPEHVIEAARDAAAKGVHSLVVITAGFAEADEAGAAAEHELVTFARRSGMRVVGPNCLGIVNTHPDVRMNATFAPDTPTPGTVGFLSQSGALGIAILGQARELGIGISSFVSVGNKADVSGNDLLEFWEHDDATDVVLLYLESFGNPRKFGRLARRVSRAKPIVAVKAGRTKAGTRAASSHTAAMASEDVAVEALFRQAGVIRVDTLWQLFDVARLLAQQPLPAGPRVCIVSNGGGPAILAADACESAGLVVAELSSETQARLREVVFRRAAVGNPVDLIAAAHPEHYEAALKIVLADPEVDAVIVGFTPPLVTRTAEVAAAILRAVEASPRKPVLANFLDTEEGGRVLSSGDLRIPTFLFPEPAAQALAHVTTYAQWRDRPAGSVPDLPGIDVSGARVLVADALAAAPGGGWLPATDAFRLAELFGLSAVTTRPVDSPEAALEVAAGLEGPYALKAASGDLVHKTEQGGLHLDLRSPEEVAGAFVEMHERLGDAMGGGVVQPMVPDGVETIVGVVHDPDFGPLVMFGMGGTTAELLADRAFRIVPLTDVDARELVDSVRGAPLLAGYRGSPPVDRAALEDLLLRVSRLTDALPEVVELDLNPVIVGPDGVSVVDAKVRLAPYEHDEAVAVRRLG